MNPVDKGGQDQGHQSRLGKCLRNRWLVLPRVTNALTFYTHLLY